MHQLVIFGATGRMGQALIRALDQSTIFRLSGAVASPGSVSLGKIPPGMVAGDVVVTQDAVRALAAATVAVDFSLPQAVGLHANACAAAGVPLVVGTTGLDVATVALLEAAARRIAVLVAPNTSVGVNVMTKLAALATRALGTGYDVEILESHHRLKRDAPSGTALSLGDAVAHARGTTLSASAVYERHGEAGPRATGSIGFSVVRAGDIVGEHTVLFAADGERIEITHRATDRLNFARGALRAAEWLIGRPAGLYHMDDVLGL
ncbi:MAG: 4-hydroxy-tetrahydrodipicolinate reductase [Steroidobacteraceae bacterium]